MKQARIGTFLLLALAGLAFAQGDRGTLTGTVTDPHGAVVPNAQISIRQPDTGAQYSTVTTSTGNYSLAQLPSAAYEVSVTFPGFKKYTQQGITVGVAQTVRIDIVMELGNATESVTVNADAP